MFIKDYLSSFEVPEKIANITRVQGDLICKFLRDSGVSYFKRYTNIKKENMYGSTFYTPIIKLHDVCVYDNDHLNLIETLIEEKFGVYCTDNARGKDIESMSLITIDIDLSSFI